MKSFLVLLALTTSMSAFSADQCSPDADETIARISEKTSCYEAKALAEECSWGSSIDVQIAGAAADVCLREAGTLSFSDMELLELMMSRCDKAYADLEGSLYRSANSFCKLEATQFITNLQNPENNG